MCSQRPGNDAASAVSDTVSRRHLLAAGGVVAIGGLSGCVSQVAARTTNTGASPAAMFGGVRGDGLIPVTPREIIKFSPTVRVEEQFLAGDVEIEAWMTNTTMAVDAKNYKSVQSNPTYCEAASDEIDCDDEDDVITPANDYNSVRSNKRRAVRFDVDDDDDASADTIEARLAALELERRLLAQTAEVMDISKRSARTGRNPQTGKEMQGRLDEISDTIDEIEATLARCRDDVCETVLESTDNRKQIISTARSYFEGDQQWDAAEETVEEVQQINEDSIELLESSLLEHDVVSEDALSITRLKELTGASDDEVRGMYEYLESGPVLGERCVITLPDARVPRGGPSIDALITPKQVIDFVTGRVDGEGKVYSWGKNTYETAAVAGEDDEDESCEQHNTSISTEQSVYCWGANTSQTNISGPTHTYGSLDVLTSDSEVVVINVTNRPPTASDTKSMIGVSSDGRSIDVDSLDEWGRESGPASSTSVIVCQVLVQPAGCPCPFPALLHVQRHENNDQYVYSCGWVIDESCLYENSVTVVAGGGGGKVSIQDITINRSGEVSGDEIRRLLPDDVSPVGAQLFFGRLEDTVVTGSLPDDELVERIAGAVSSDGDVYCSCYPFDGHCLHLVDDGNTSDTVKFKAGAELSKSVN